MNRRLSRIGVHLTRGLWVVFSLLSIVVFTAGIINLLSALATLKPPSTANLRDLLASPYFQAQLLVPIDIIFVLMFGGVGLILAYRKSTDGFVLAISVALLMYAVTATTAVQNLWQKPQWNMLVTFLEGVSTASVPILAYLFPDGRFIPRWTRWLALGWGVWALLIPLFPALNPYLWPTLYLYVLFVGGLVSGIGAQVYRYRRISTMPQLQQTKWVIFGFATAILGFSAIALILWLVLPVAEIDLTQFLLANSAFYLSQLFVPVSIGFSVMRYRLWDIDSLINRTIVYTIVTGIIALIFFLGSNVLDQFIDSLVGGSSLLAPLGSGLVAAVLFNPLKQHTQTVVDRRFYREKIDFQNALTEFAHEARRTTHSSVLLYMLLSRASDLFHTTHSALYIRDDPKSQNFKITESRDLPDPLRRDFSPDPETLKKLSNGLAISQPNDPTFPLLIPLNLPPAAELAEPASLRLMGVLTLGPRLSDLGFSRENINLLLSLADHVGTAIYLARVVQQQQKESPNLSKS